MVSKTSGNLPTRLPPWDYKRFGFEWWTSVIDGTTKRFNENSKVVVIEGPPALGKTEVAKAIADELYEKKSLLIMFNSLKQENMIPQFCKCDDGTKIWIKA